jgi:hypothetical protein
MDLLVGDEFSGYYYNVVVTLINASICRCPI